MLTSFPLKSPLLFCRSYKLLLVTSRHLYVSPERPGEKNKVMSTSSSMNMHVKIGEIACNEITPEKHPPAVSVVPSGKGTSNNTNSNPLHDQTIVLQWRRPEVFLWQAEANTTACSKHCSKIQS